MLELKKVRVEKLIVKNKFSWDIKKKEELNAELIQIDLEFENIYVTQWTAKVEARDAENEIDEKLNTFQEEIYAIED
jgi:hypothetical protein